MELGNGSSVANWGLSGDSDRKQPCTIITHGAVLVAACWLPPRHEWDNETRSRESTLRNRFMSLKAYQTAEDWKAFSKITDRSLQLTVEAILSFIVMPASPALTKVGLKSALNTQWEFLWVADVSGWLLFWCFAFSRLAAQRLFQPYLYNRCFCAGSLNVSSLH